MIEEYIPNPDLTPEQNEQMRKLFSFAAKYNYLQDSDNDTLIQCEESEDEDKVRIDTGGTERVVIDSTGIDFKDHQALNFIIENRTNDTGMTVTGQIWFRTDV